MAARLRRKGELAPQYEVGAEVFSLEVHHGGFFVGSGHLRSYVDEKVDWFDWIECDTWSSLWFEDFLQQLGYENNASVKFYWLLPGKTIADGLRIIVSDHDTNVMAKMVEKYRTLVVYVDHDDNFADVNWDDVVANPMAELPKVISPSERTLMSPRGG